MANFNPWMYAGRGADYPNIKPSTDEEEEATSISQSSTIPSSTSDTHLLQPCKLFQRNPTSTSLIQSPLEKAELASILVFRYRDTIHAMEHSCPHSAYPLSNGSLHDIEDFGIVFSTGITCPKHGWTFDLHTGKSSVGRYELGLYDVETRPRQGGDYEVWIKKKEKRKRIG